MVIKSVAHIVLHSNGRLYRFVSEFRLKLAACLLLFAVFALAVQGCAKKDDGPATDTTASVFETPAVADIVMYEVNPGAFSATKNLQGVTNRLDQIKALGVNTIWLMPIYPIGVLKSFGSPYCVRNYTEVNPDLGTMQDLQTLVSEAHKRNIAVILDWVANHTSWDNPWISNPSWYTQDANGNIISPAGTNWNDVADLNYNNSNMRQAMIAAMKYWVTTADIDGYRCDAADFVPFDFWQQAITALKGATKKNLILLAEGSRADHFIAGFQMNYGWDFLASLKSVFGSNQDAGAIFVTNTAEYSVVPSGCRKLRFTTNHDESNIATPVSVFGGNNGALAASVVTIFLQGVPLIYCGQEVGVSSTSVYNGGGPISWSENPNMLASYTTMLNFYDSSAAARNGTLTTYTDRNVVVFQKTSGTEHVLVIVNVRATDETYALPSALQGDWTDALAGSTLTLGANIVLSPYQYYVLKR